ncbi:MAG: aromatic amino acid ammonia-lyase [Caldisphaera sp.]|jgi:histidine ammonia-lyase|nr:MAG: aromatic amino acid lyase [Caldisphaera sp.]
MTIICDDKVAFNEIFDKYLFSKIEICNKVREKLNFSREIYENEASKSKIYGYSTSLGALINKEEKNLDYDRERIILMEHDTSIGKPAPKIFSKITMLVRLIQLSKGNSPIRSIIIDRLKDSINYGIIPVVPILGSVGASGDLSPLARIFRCIIYGEGSSYYNDSIIDCNHALKQNGLNTLDLKFGEALALINSNAWSTGLSLINTYLAENLLNISIDVIKESLKLTGCNNQHFSKAVYETKLQKGVKKVIDVLNNPCEKTPRLQDPYSIRCVPQIYGAVFDLIDYAKSILENEANSTSDNPIVYDNTVYHACQFHAIYSALISDFLKTALISVMNSIERRISQMLDNKINNKSEFLVKEKSVVGAMIYQYTAAELSAYSRGISNPMSSHSIPTSGTQEDVVSMAPNSSLELSRINGLLAKLISIEKAINMFDLEKNLPDPRLQLNEAYNNIIKRLENYKELLEYFY